MAQTKVPKILSILPLLSVLWFMPLGVLAADFSFLTSATSYQVGEIIPVKIIVSSPSQAINALSGVINFSATRAEVSSVSKSNSVVNMWVQEPSFSNREGQVSFEGVVLNPGYRGKNGLVLTINLKPKSAGQLKLSLSNGSILANDGEGTNVLNNSGTIILNIREKVADVVKKETPTSPPKVTISTTSATSIDTISPEQLAIIEIPSDVAGQARFSFSAQDSGSGLAYYLLSMNGLVVARLPAEATSYQTNSLDSGWHELQISVFDKAGNETQAKINFEIKSGFLPSRIFTSINPLIALVIALVLLVIGLLMILISRFRFKGQSMNTPGAVPLLSNGLSSGARITLRGQAIGAKAIILMHNGQITAEAGPGPSGKFEFSLENIVPGLHHFSLVTVEGLGNPALTYDYPLMLSAGASVVLEDIVLKLPSMINPRTVENSYQKDINYREPNV